MPCRGREDSNKHIIEETVRQVGYLLEEGTTQFSMNLE
jgi:hypothetical protein